MTGNMQPTPLATYAWVPGPKIHVHVNERMITSMISDTARVGMCAVTLSLYECFKWQGQLVMRPNPVHQTAHIVFPHFLLSESHMCLAQRFRTENAGL